MEFASDKEENAGEMDTSSFFSSSVFEGSHPKRYLRTRSFGQKYHCEWLCSSTLSQTSPCFHVSTIQAF